MYIHHFRMVPMIGLCSTTFLMVNDGDFSQMAQKPNLSEVQSPSSLEWTCLWQYLLQDMYIYIYKYMYVCYVLCMCIICILISTRELFLIFHPFFWSMLRTLWMSSCRANRQTTGSPGQIYVYIQYTHFSEEMWCPAPLKYDRYVLYPLKEGHPKWSMIWVRSCWLGHIRAGAPGQGP